ncbi:hypothetical protein PCANC_07563 [Puccinia coronata f. sp. avenae]|uniref:Uncharacterized protein n=1 Tax=Puccinia coronata f. sp. avenae TaxID=200324 RepID=A0A2N5VSN3_9BASI|nr:hypothetical protein PCANC_07563 [Puccinia coronata f. sp. avenae]
MIPARLSVVGQDSREFQVAEGAQDERLHKCLDVASGVEWVQRRPSSARWTLRQGHHCDQKYVLHTTQHHSDHKAKPSTELGLTPSRKDIPEICCIDFDL